MPGYDDLFARDALDDTGETPYTGAYPYWSPDVINQTSQVVDPTTFFTDNYDNDPNQAMEMGQYNYIYVRTKNLAAESTGGTMQVYYCGANLVMYPQTWNNNLLTTADGENSVILPSVASQGVSVGAKCFPWIPQGWDNYGLCFIGHVITRLHHDPIPESFDNPSDFITWVTTHPDICWRNVVLENNLPDPDYTTLIQFSNPNQMDVPITFRAVCVNLPLGTQVILQCSAISLYESAAITSDKQDIYASATVPKGFTGYLEVQAFLPPGGVWQGSIEVFSYIGVDPAVDYGGPMELFAEDWLKHGVRPADCLLKAGGFLVKLGNVTIKFS